MTIEEAQKKMDINQPVDYHGKIRRVIGINKLNNTVTIDVGMIGKDVAASELKEIKQ